MLVPSQNQSQEQLQQQKILELGPKDEPHHASSSSSSSPSLTEKTITLWRRSGQFFSKYFLEGQQLDEKVKDVSDYKHDDTNIDGNHNTSSKAPFHVRYRKVIAMSIPALVVHTIWWSIMIANDWFHLFREPSQSSDKPRYYMSITMVFGSMVAGCTSEGGGAVAFPVMTLALGIPPIVARDFSFMIQSVGMVGASFTILAMRVAVEWNSILWVSLGGVVGIVFGLELIAPRLSPAYSKMYFVVIWSSFAIGLFLLNRTMNRKVHNKIQGWDEAVVWKAPGVWGRYFHLNWKREALVAFGILGGTFSSMAGSGIDICSFAALTLLFRVSEKVATPTSVILMAINTAAGFFYREVGMGGVEEDAWGFLAVCAPIVVIGAPLGAFIGSYWHRLTLAGIVYIIDAAQLIGALYFVQPWTTKETETPLHLSLTSLAIFLGGSAFFQFLSYFGLKLSELSEHNSSQRNVDTMHSTSCSDDQPEQEILADETGLNEMACSDE